MRLVPRTLSQRTLLWIASSMTAVILLATGATYLLTFSAIEDRSLAQVRQYTEERTRREEMRFVLAEENHSILRQVLLDRLQLRERASHVDAHQRFEALLERTADGAVRSRRELGQGTRHTTTWIHKDTELTPELESRIVLLHDLCEQFFPAWQKRVQSLYISGPERFNTGFDPLFPMWVWEIPADWDQSREAWAKIATVKDNPERVSAWTGVTLDPTTKIPIVTLSTPVDFAGRHVATLHHDISLEALVRENLRPDQAHMTHFIFRDDGLLIAHPDKLAQQIMGGGQLKIAEADDVRLRSLYRAVQALPSLPAAGYDPASESYFAVSRLTGPGWLFLTSLPRASVRRDAFESAQWVLWTGLCSLGLMVFLHMAILRREIARPLSQLTRAVERMRRGEPAQASLGRDDELGQLGRAFDQMAADVASRDALLQDANRDLERRVELRTHELTVANEQLEHARRETLALLSRERELSELKSGFVSLVSHEVRTPLGVIQSSADILDRYAERLTPAERRGQLETIFRSVANLTELVDGVLMLGRIEDGRIRAKPRMLDLATLCAQIVDEVASATNRPGVIQLDVEADLPHAEADPDLLRHILFNLLNNAVKYSTETPEVVLSLSRRGDSAHFIVRDRGIGIPPADRDKLFTSFSRGGNVGTRPGTGLGLMIVERCVHAHAGTISLDSELGVGTTVEVSLPVFGSFPVRASGAASAR